MSRRLLLLFAGSVLLPGLILAYLSFRSVKDENLLIEKSMDDRHMAFVEELGNLLQKIRQLHLDQLRERLRAGGSTGDPLEAWSLASRLLDNPIVQSVVVFRNDSALYPHSPRGGIEKGALPTTESLPRILRPLTELARQEWQGRRYPQCLKVLRTLLHGPDSLSDQASSSLRAGFRMMEIKCFARLDLTAEAVESSKSLIGDILDREPLDSPSQTGYYLSEIVNLLTSMERLPRDTREEMFLLHERLPLFLSNADRVEQEWPSSPEEILRSLTDAPADSLKINYREGYPYLQLGYPWLAGESRAILRLDDGVFLAAVRAEFAMDKSIEAGPWKDISFAISNGRDETVLATPNLEDREPALERSYGEDFPAWRVVVYRRPPGELLSLSRQRMALQYTLLGFSLIAILLGTLILFTGLDKEKRMARMKSNFLSAVSHELKTPLTAIRMFAEMLSTGRQTQEEKKLQYADRIGIEAERLQGMIEGILSYTRLEENPRALRFRDLDLCEVARETADLLGNAYAKAGIQLKTEMSPTARLRADYDAMRSVLINLLENSLKYSGSGTTVTLEIRDLEQKIMLRVADQGVGIAPADMKHIFERFYRAGDELTRKTRGSGLGLSLVKRIVDAHGGEIKVHSKLNEGTEMILYLPGKKGTHA